MFFSQKLKALFSTKWLLFTLLLGLASLPLFMFTSSSHFNDDYSAEVTFQPVVLLNEEAQLNNVHFIFLNGLGCIYDNSIYDSMGFETIRSSLAALGFSFCDERFLLYSYTGGVIQNNKWYPEKYTAKDTGQPLNVSVDKLADLFEKFSLAKPEAAYVLVGHSLGGRIALDFISTTSPLNKEKVKGIITLDSPLTGAGRKIPNFILNILHYRGSIFGSPVIRELCWESYFQQEIAKLRCQTIKALQNNGIRVATFSSRHDHFVKPLTACLVDEHQQAVSDGIILNLGMYTALDRYGHVAILDSPHISKYIISLCTE